MLPLLSPLRHNMIGWSQHDRVMAAAVRDFVGVLPDGSQDYRRAMRDAALVLYAKAAGDDADFFVDKTPPYHQIVDDLVATFPDGRFVFLWRHPLAMVASSMELFHDGLWEVNRESRGLFASVAALVAASRSHSRISHAVRFEDLVRGDEETWRRLTTYIGFDLDPAALSNFTAVRLQGRMGDPRGTVKYGGLASEPLDKWHASLRSPVRKAWCRRYLRWIGAERLSHMGYDLEAILAELDSVPAETAGTLDDARRLATSALRDISKRVIPPHTREPSVWPRLLSRTRGGKD
jgi:sulfotransferase family protein